MSDSDRLLTIASAIADGGVVSWTDEERQAAGGADAASLTALRGLEELLTALRRADREDEPTAPTSHLDIANTPTAPRRWRHLTILGTIGKGSFGTVYRAHDPNLGLDVALKLLSTVNDRDRRTDDVLKEARLLARVRHPNVVRVYGADESEESVGLWMELVQGFTLRQLLRTHGRFSAQEASIIGRDLCRAIAAVHQAGVLHGDIKAHNVMRESGGRIVLMDFGSGQAVSGEPCKPGATMAGTPAYLAPEVLTGSPRSVSSDIYALGVLLYHLVTGSYPVTGTSIDALVAANNRGERQYLRDVCPDLPHEFIRIIDRAVATDPAVRYSSVGQFEDALVRATSSDHGVPVQTGTLLRSGPALYWRRALVAAAATIALAVGATMFWLTERSTSPAGAPREANAAGTTGTVAVETVAAAGVAADSYDIEAAFFRAARAGEERLQPDARVAPGDELFLKLKASVPVHVYVVNEDDRGAAYLLFPLPGGRLTNPLPAGQMVTVPGADRWRVTTPGEREHFVVFASPKPVESLDKAFAQLPIPRVGTPVSSVAMARADVERLRGVGGLTAAPAAEGPGGRLARLFTIPLTDEREHSSGLWIRQITLDNPVR